MRLVPEIAMPTKLGKRKGLLEEMFDVVRAWGRETEGWGDGGKERLRGER
jgi:hypothetical protein